MKFCVLDLETTGTDPDTDSILEVGAIMLTEQLEELGRFHSLVRQTHGVEWGDLDAVVQDMHEKNGLRAQIDAGEGLPCRVVEGQLVDWIRYLAQGETVLLAGNSVHFDRSFLAVDMPCVIEALHYRQQDIGALCRELRACGVDLPAQPKMAHRGLEDAVIELAEWRQARVAIRELVSRPKPVAGFDAAPVVWGL